MSVAQEPRVATPEAGSDRAVVKAVRAGEIGQFALLYQRYHAEALRIARRQVGADEAQDLVQETFARVLRAIRGGGGPTEDVAGYIFRSLRNLRIDRGGQREFATEDVENAGPAGLWVVADRSEEVLDRGLVADAFAELPPRWREVLWLTEVEGVGPGELSQRMGIKPTAVSTLSLRARAGFRSAWLQAHVRAGSAPSDCRPVVARLGDYQTGRLSSRRRAQVEQHLDHCDHCPAVVAELTAVSDHLGVLLLPVVVLAPKALWWVFGGWGVKAGFLLWGTKAALGKLRDPKVAIGSVSGAATVAVTAAVVMAMTAPPEPPPAADPSPSASAPATSSQGPSSSVAASSDPDASSEEPASDRAAAEEPSDQTPPASSPTSVPVLPPDPDPVEPADDAATEPEPTDPAPTTEPEPTDPEPSDPGEQSTESEEPVDPPSVPQPPELSTGPAEGQVDGPALELAGVGAVPGAIITARDADGATVATDVVDTEGAWAVSIEEPAQSSDVAAAGGTAGPAGAGLASMGVGARALAEVVTERGDELTGEDVRDEDGNDESQSTDDGYYFTLTQTVDDGDSDEYAGESEPLRVGPYTWATLSQPDPVDPPSIICPDDDATVRLWPYRDRIAVGYIADEDYEVRFFLDGDEITVEDSLGVLLSPDCDGNSHGIKPVWLTEVTEGDHELTLQYVSDAGELVGTADTVHFTVTCVWWGCGATEDDVPEPESGATDAGTAPGAGLAAGY